MVHTDKIVKEFELDHEGVIDFKEFLNLIKDFFKKYDYDLTEKLYNGKTKEGLKSTEIKWQFDKKVDDYNQCFVKMKIKLNDYKEGYVDGKKIADGKLVVEIEGEIVRDYDLKWKIAPIRKFFRALYDKYVVAVKQDKVANELKSIINNLEKDIKQYLAI